MPFDKTQQVPAGYLGISEFDEPDPLFMDTVGAAFRQENLIGSAISDARTDLTLQQINRVQAGYNPFDDIEGYEDQADLFDESYNPEKTAAIKANIDREREDRRILDESGWTGNALQMGMAVADPTIFIPGGALVRSGRVGYGAARSALAVGAGAAAGAAVQEAGLQATQETRSGLESAAGIGGAAILGGAFGYGVAKFLTKGEWSRLAGNLERELAEDVPNPQEVAETMVSRMESVGAAAVDQIKIDDLGVGGGKAAQAVAKATEALALNPGVQTMFSPSKVVRKTYQEMVDNSIYTKMNMEGETLGPSVENLVKQLQRGALAKWEKESKSLWKQARNAGFEGKKKDFYARISRAARRGDVDEFGNEYVTEAAKKAREYIFDPTLQQAIDANLLPDDIKVSTAASYLTRMWNRQRLIAREDEFREIANRYFRNEIAKIPEADRPDFISKDELDSYIEDVVTSVLDNLTGRGNGDVPDYIVPIKRGPLKERAFRISDYDVEDFLENDMEAVLRYYTRTMGAEVELAKKFGRADMKDQIEAIRREYTDLRLAEKTEAGKKKLAKAEERDIKNLQAFRDLIRGTYRAADEGSNWSRITRAALTWNYMRLLGGVTLTSMTDAARLVGVHGLRATMREALPALVSNVRAAKISRADARELGAVTEAVLQTRLATLAEIQDPYAFGSPYERFLSNASDVFSKATGLSYWNDGMKTIASVMTQNRMARNALNWKAAGKDEQAYMAYLGIDEMMAGRISKQIRKHGLKEKGIWGANVSEWEDEYAKRVWAAALNKDVDRTIVTKGVADTPLWTRTNAGKLVFQFKSFAMASHQKVLIAGLQENPLRLAENLVFASALGMMVGYLKFIERGDQENADRLLDNPGLWMAEGLDRSGILAIPFEISNTMEKLGSPVGIQTALQAATNDPDRGGSVSRYAQRNKLGAVLGPSAGVFQDLTTIAEQLSKGDLKKSGAGAIVRQIPGGSLPGIRTGMYGFVRPMVNEAVE